MHVRHNQGNGRYNNSVCLTHAYQVISNVKDTLISEIVP